MKEPKKKNIKLIIEYDGTDYAGWQRQKNTDRTIQAVLEKALFKILREKVTVVGSGRTDAGVHAAGQTANFKTGSKLPPRIIKKALNSELPKDIVVRKANLAGDDFHARFRAKSKLYRYRILNQTEPSVFERRFAGFVPYRLDAGLMKRAARVLRGKHDFKSFQAADKKERDSVRRIYRLSIKREKSRIVIEIEADGFLRGMARAIVGTLIEIGRGKISTDSMRKILKARDRKLAGPAAPAKGLCLVRVKY